MKKIILITISFIGLALTIIPSFLVFDQKIPLEQNKTLMFIGTLVWFVTAPFWMKRKKDPA
jgi:hypothetical protein